MFSVTETQQFNITGISRFEMGADVDIADFMAEGKQLTKVHADLLMSEINIKAARRIALKRRKKPGFVDKFHTVGQI